MSAPSNRPKPLPALSLGDIRRFWAFVGRKPTNDSGCWIWQGPTNYQGLPVFHVAGRAVMARRIAYAIGHGAPVVGIRTYVRCGERLCVNPDCISMRPNRSPQTQGANHRSAALTAGQARELRRRYRAGASLSQLASEYGVSTSTAWAVGTERRYANA